MMSSIYNRSSIIIAMLLMVVSFQPGYAQGYNQEKTALINFLVRLYESAPFDGVKLVEDYEQAYLMSVVKLDKGKYNSESTMNRVAQVKAMSQASRFFNGSRITDDLIIRIHEKSNGSSEMEIIESINEHSVGYVKQLEHLTNFTAEKEYQVFIYLTPVNVQK